MNSSQPAELGTEKLKNLKNSTDKIKFIKLILFFIAIIILLFWNIFTGRVNLSINFSNFTSGLNLNYYYTETIKTIIELKEYLITFFIMIILLYFIMKRNIEWERKYLEDLAKREEEKENNNLNSNFNANNENENLAEKKNN